MSVSLVVLRFEIAENSPKLNHLQYQAPLRAVCGSAVNEIEPNSPEWPVLYSERLFAIHRGQRKPATITVITLDHQTIGKEMAALNYEDDSSIKKVCISNSLRVDLTKGDEKTIKPSIGGGGIPKTSSKESTPGPSSSKEGTPVATDDYSRWRSGVKESLHFISGNPTVDLTQGILHLFKENSKTSLDEEEMRSEMLCMLAVPTSMNTHDLLQFIAPCYPAIQHLRIIRNTNPNQYMALIKFKSQAEADFFFNTFNGQTFNSMEPEICKLVYVARVETTNELEEGGLPIPGHSELPTCPVCLERMDESVDGILTILCNHSFHGECLAKWGDASCPVCRYCQTPEEIPDQQCFYCGATDSLWICLICGHVGCGRYVGGHAHRHFIETNHLFSLQVGNNRVWDYVRDNYVHRLLQSEGDGKVVSFERCPPASGGKELVDGEEKINALQLEYTHLLSSQLESQREYFEVKITEARIEALREAEENKNLAQKKSEEIAQMKGDLLGLKKEKQSVDKKLQSATQKLTKITNDLDTEKQLNLNLREGKTELVVKVEQLEKTLNDKAMQIKELESQLHDIMAHFEVATTIENNPELQGGAIALGQTKPTGARRKRK